ncbi:MAG: creatininase family protein [Azospirillaceae bacterium]
MIATRPRRYWHELTTKDFAALDAERTIAVLPVAAIEQHGPHLPVWVDDRINRGILDAALAAMPDDLAVLVLPAQHVGKSDEHDAFPGTLSLSAETLIRVWSEIGESVWRAGVRKLVLFNSHGGQPQVSEIVARDLRVRLGMFVVSVHWGRLGVPEGLFSKEEEIHGIHGGGIETAMMMHLAPDLVVEAERRNFPPISIEMARDYVHLMPEGNVSFGWQAQDLNPAGACGDASDADAERGRQLVEHAAAELVNLLQDVDRFPLGALNDHV